MDKYQYLIYGQINKSRYRAHKSFHTPGHKAQGDFKRHFRGAELDITELSYSDNLHCPEGVIKRAQEDIAQILGAAASYILTDGSTSGVYCMAYAAAKRGVKIIVPRNSHRSVYNACKLFNIEPVIVQGAENEGVLTPPDPELIEKLLAKDKSIGAVLITSPDYYGNVSPLAKYAEITKKYKRLLLVDGAHGSHLAFEEGDLYAGKFADMWVDGAHKSLPTLTQGALLNVGNSDLIAIAEEALNLFRTTSPSYPIMASVEYGVKYCANHPEKLALAKQAAQNFKNGLTGFDFYPSDDWTKVAVDFKKAGVNPDYAVKTLEKRGIYPELCDGRYILFYLSVNTTAGALKAASDALLSVANNARYANSYRERQCPIPAADRTYSYLYALKQPWEYVPLEKAEGRMCAENAGVNPPCVPVIVAGEMVGKDAIAALKRSGGTFGVYGGKIKVTKK